LSIRLRFDAYYLDKDKRELRHNEGAFSNIQGDQYAIDMLAGFVKHDAWEFERETRLAVKIRKNENIENSPTHIFAGITRELIKTFHVTFNPWLSEEMKSMIRNCLKEVAGFNIVCSDSVNDGEIHEL